MIRVLVADDSPTLRDALATLLGEYPDISIVGQARDGVEAVNLARTLRPDVITMDVNMPRLDGLGATAAIMADAPARVLVISSVSESQLSFKAMAAGALEMIPKPASGDLRAWGRRLAQSVRLMAEVPVVRRPVRARPMPAVRHAGDVDVIALVASTGGPPAIAQVLGELPGDLCPILVAQHIADGFTAGLVRWFGASCKPKAEIARDGHQPQQGHVYLPPDGCDVEVDPSGHLHVPRANGPHCPSGNRLLASLARVHGPRAAGFVLTGMGDDGAQGLLALRQSGGATFAQDESTSVVYGMPQAAFACGAARSQLALEQVAPAILSLCRKAASK
jgi:two-component system chemotaxis response regulator CheB